MSLAQRIRQARNRAGLTQQQLAAALSVSRAAVAQWETGASDPALDKIPTLARALSVSPDFLLSGAGALIAPPMAPATAPATDEPTDVPLIATAGSQDPGGAFYLMAGQIVDYVRRPPGIRRNRQAFALHVRGAAMVPKFEEGDILYLDPARPPRVGDYVLIELLPETAGAPPLSIVRRLIGRSPETVSLARYNPAAEETMPLNAVQRIVCVLSLTDLIN